MFIIHKLGKDEELLPQELVREVYLERTSHFSLLEESIHFNDIEKFFIQQKQTQDGTIHEPKIHEYYLETLN